VPEAIAARSRPIADSVEELIGGTPLVRLRLPGIPADITALAKLEMANPLSTSKDRAALFMIAGAERRGELIPGAGTIVEASSGNTGISLAALAAARGYPCIIVVPDSVTLERRQILRTLGATVVLTPRAAGYRGAIAKAQELQLATPGAWMSCQHENADNVRAHYETTGPEIWDDTQGRIDVLVCGVGTGGTLTGIARYLKERNPAIRVVAVEPEGSPVLSGGAGGLHGIPGLNGGFIAATTDVSCIDEIVIVSDAEATSTARRLSRTAGLLVGISSGAAARACERIAPMLQPGAIVVTVLPDTGERYLSLWQEEQAEAIGAESVGGSLALGAGFDEAEVAAR
jgi:cysteine synthase A